MKDPARLAVVLLALTAVAARWFLRAPDVEGFDSVGFALALDHYDLTARTPHFPGYPVYIAAARFFRTLGLGHVDALVAPNALGAGVLAVCAAWLGRRIHSPRAGVCTAALATFLPGLHLVGARPLSEGLGAAWLMVLMVLAVRLWDGAGHPMWIGVWAGLLLGVRPAWIAAPAGLFLVFLVARPRVGARLVLGAALGCVAWLGLLVMLTPWDALVTAAQRVLVGHFTVWGGTALTDEDTTSRSARLLWDLWVWGLGGATTTDDGWARQIASLVALGALAGVLKLRHVPRPLGGAVVLTVLYVLVGANPNNPRHMTQVLCVLLPFLGLALAHAREGALVLAGLLALPAIPVAVEQATVPSPAVQVATFLGHVQGAHFYGFTTMRTVEWKHAATTNLVETLPQACELQDSTPRTNAFFESRLREKRRRDFSFEPVATFTRDPRVDPAGAAITIYRMGTPCRRAVTTNGE